MTKNLRAHIRDVLQQHIPKRHLLLEVPPSRELGDFAVPCFSLAKHYKESPSSIAARLAKEIRDPLFTKIVAAGPYLNLFLDRRIAAEHIFSGDLSCKKKKQTILFEYPAPNTNKPLHLGHLRTILLGSSSAAICEAAGNAVVRANLFNDRGVHICKSMLAYKKFGEGSTPESFGMKPDHFVGHWYVEYGKHAQDDPSLDEETQTLLQKWEAGDTEVRALWKRMNDWAYMGYAETFARLGITHDIVHYESEHYDKAKSIVEAGVKDGVFMKEDDGTTIVDLEEQGLGKKVLLRQDGTTVYMTQDLYLAELRQKEFHPDAQVYVVGSEQEHHFKQLFAILDKLGMEHAKTLYHLSYGMISLPSGKMKSREGTIVDVDDLLDEMESLAAKAVKQRHPNISGQELKRRSIAIGHAALRFYILKFEPRTAFTYHPEESLSFEGETGPYIQYAVARINSILRDAPTDGVTAGWVPGDEEWHVLLLLNETKTVVEEAALQYRPHLVARHALMIAQAFTAFYHACPILKASEQERNARLALIGVVKEHLAHLCGLLGIALLEEM